MALATRPNGTYSTHSSQGRTGPATPQTGRAAYCGITQRGPANVALEVTSYAGFTRRYGGAFSGSALPEQVKHHFDRGGGPLVIARNQGVGATNASVNIPGSSGTTAILAAVDAGDHANSWTVDREVSGTDFRLVVYDGDDNEIANSGLLATRDEIPDAFADSIYVSATIGGGSGDPTAGTGTAFTGGANGTTNDTSAASALALLGPEWGTLNVAFPGDTSSARHAQIKAHCESGIAPIRVPVLDHADASASTTATAIEALWDAPGVPAVHCVSSAPTTDGGLIYGSVLWCAAAAASDRENVPGFAIAAGRGTFPGLTSLTREFSYADRLVLDNAGATYMVLDDPDARGVRNVMIFSDRLGTDPEDADAMYEASDLRVAAYADAYTRFEQRDFRFAPLTDEYLGRIYSASVNVGLPLYQAGVISDDDGNGSTGNYSDAYYIEVEKTGPREVTTSIFYRPSPGAAIQQINVVRLLEN